MLKEYVARGNYIYPPEPTMRLTTDIFEYCRENVPKWNTISISGYHIREKGCSAVQEVAFTLSNAIAYVEAALDRGLEIDEFAPRLAFFFNCHNNVFQEIAKFRAVRRMWARIVRERFGSEAERSQMIRFHTQTGGVTLQAQQPEVNIIRVALQGFAAVCGGTQSLHTNGFDEALALPTERSARIALRTQQVIAHESGAADTVDPFAGSYFVESLTDEIEAARLGADRARSPSSAARSRRSTSSSARSRSRRSPTTSATRPARTSSSASTSTSPTRSTTSTSSRSTRRPSGARSSAWRSSRPTATRRRVERRLEELRDVARGDGNLLLPIQEALARRAPRSARSAARCATCSASTRAGRSSRARCVCSSLGQDEIVVAGCDRAAGDGAGRQKPALHGIEGEAHPGQVGARALGARRRPARMESWMGGLVGSGGRSPVEVTDREPGAHPRLARRAQPGAGRPASRSSSPRAASAPRCGSPPSTRGADPGEAIAALEGLLDELGSPERRPFGAA